MACRDLGFRVSKIKVLDWVLVLGRPALGVLQGPEVEFIIPRASADRLNRCCGSIGFTLSYCRAYIGFNAKGLL